MADRRGRMPVWDAAVRLFHWSLAGIVVFNLVRDDGDQIHRWVGYVACGIVAARLAWGALFASSPGRLRDLKPSFSTTWAYLRELRRGRFKPTEGHNPLGTWMIWVLWTLVLLLGASGWTSRTDRFWGEDLPIDIHAFLADALLVCVGLHLAGVIVMSLLQRQNLPLTMITGRKSVAAAEDLSSPRRHHAGQ